MTTPDTREPLPAEALGEVSGGSSFSRRDALKALVAYMGGVFLVACTPSTKPALPTIDVSPTPPVSPTPARTPTETPDPLAGAPEGATGKNSKGEWIKTVTENGKQVTFEWDAEFNVWFTSHITGGNLLNGGINLYEHNDDPYNAPDMIPMYVYFAEGVQGPYVQHPDAPGRVGVVNLTGLISNWIHEWFIRDKYHRDPVYDDALDPEWIKAAQEGTLSLPFTTSEGTFQFKPGVDADKGNYIVKVVNWDAADPAKDPRFIEWSYWNPGIEGRSMTLGDANGGVIAFIASKKSIDTLSPDELRALILFPFVRVLLAEDQSQEYYENKQWRGHAIASFIRFAGIGPIPHIEIVTNP